MSETVIELCDVSKIYKKTKVVDGVNLAVDCGHIMGLLGPNGAGKTTLLKLLAGLTRLDEGKILFYGSEEGLDQKRRRMSFMLEEPILDPLMTARNNMKYVCYVKEIADAEKKIGEILELVGLQETGKKLVKEFSLGMKQRLGIGMALLSEPEVLVLDEPMNGLDPEGMVEMRNLLKELSVSKKVTILISSHILSELSELCTDYTIMCKGKLLESMSVDEWTERSKRRIILVTDDIDKTVALLQEKLGIANYRVSEAGEIILYEFPENIESISKVIMEGGLLISKLLYEGESLEQYYLSKVGGNIG